MTKTKYTNSDGWRDYNSRERIISVKAEDFEKTIESLKEARESFLPRVNNLDDRMSDIIQSIEEWQKFRDAYDKAIDNLSDDAMLNASLDKLDDLFSESSRLLDEIFGESYNTPDYNKLVEVKNSLFNSLEDLKYLVEQNLIPKKYLEEQIKVQEKRVNKLRENTDRYYQELNALSIQRESLSNAKELDINESNISDIKTSFSRCYGMLSASIDKLLKLREQLLKH